jgi:hypothetical protein
MMAGSQPDRFLRVLGGLMDESLQGACGRIGRIVFNSGSMFTHGTIGVIFGSLVYTGQM